MRRAATLSLVLCLAAFAAPAHAQMVNENLLVVVPDGYKIDFRDHNDQRLINEMVPEAQKVTDWTEMVTVQIFYHLVATPEQFKSRMESLWAESCANSSSHVVSFGLENGYPVGVFKLTCPLNKDTGKPEITWMKAIQGKDSFYVVQKAFKFEPTDDDVAKWMRYLRRVAVCDSRVPERACPAAKP